MFHTQHRNTNFSLTYQKRLLLPIIFYLLLFVPSVSFAGSVEIVTQGPVTATARQDALFAAAKVQDFFKEYCDMTLDRDVKIIIVAGREAYSKAQIAENNVTKAEAERRARTTRAWSQKNVIIQNSADATLNTSVERILNIAHEMVHQYQNQASGGHPIHLEWLAEGAADAIAAKILELNKLQTVAQFRQQRLNSLRDVKSLPSLAELETPANWYKALDRHGSKAPYRVADMAVLELLKDVTYKDIFAYYSLVRTAEPRNAFQAVFQKNLSAFITETDQMIRREVSQRK